MIQNASVMPKAKMETLKKSCLLSPNTKKKETDSGPESAEKTKQKSKRKGN